MELNGDLGRYEVDEEQLEKYVDDLDMSKKILDEKKKLLDKLEMQQEIFECPGCEIQLRFRDEELHILENSVATEIHEQEDIETVSEEIDKLERKVSSLERVIPIKQNKLQRYTEIVEEITNIENQYDELPKLDEVRNDLEYIRSYRASQKELGKLVEKFESQIREESYSSTITTFRTSLEKLKNRIRMLGERDEVSKHPGIDEEKLRENIMIQKRNKEKLEGLGDSLKVLSLEKSKYQSSIEECKEKHISTYKKIRTISHIDSKMRNLRCSVSSFSRISIFSFHESYVSLAFVYS